MPGFIAVLAGPGHTFEYVNDVYVQLAGRRDYVGRTVRDALPEVEAQGFLDLLDNVYRTGRPHSARTLPIRFAGEASARYVDFLYQPILGNGAVTGIFVRGYEVTDRVRDERRRDALLALDDRPRDLTDTAELSHAASQLLGTALAADRVGCGHCDPPTETFVVERDWARPGIASVAGLHHFRFTLALLGPAVILRKARTECSAVSPKRNRDRAMHPGQGREGPADDRLSLREESGASRPLTRQRIGFDPVPIREARLRVRAAGLASPSLPLPTSHSD